MWCAAFTTAGDWRPARWLSGAERHMTTEARYSLPYARTTEAQSSDSSPAYPSKSTTWRENEELELGDGRRGRDRSRVPHRAHCREPHQRRQDVKGADDVCGRVPRSSKCPET